MQVRIEVIPWLSQAFRPDKSGRYLFTEEIEPGKTLRDLLNRLAERYPAFAESIFDRQTQQVQDHVSIIVNGRWLELLDGLDQKLEEADTVTFLPAFAGGGCP